MEDRGEQDLDPSCRPPPSPPLPCSMVRRDGDAKLGAIVRPPDPVVQSAAPQRQVHLQDQEICVMVNGARNTSNSQCRFVCGS